MRNLQHPPQLAEAVERGGHSEQQTRLLAAILDKFESLPNALRQQVADDLWADIPTFVDESAYTMALAAGGTLAVSPQVSGLVLVQSIVVTVPAGATGLVQLRETAIPVPAGVTAISGIRKLLGPSDTRALTIAGAAGPASLWLTGTQRPTYGVMAK